MLTLNNCKRDDYIFPRNSKYYFRQWIPTDLRVYFGRTEIRQSIPITGRRDAKRKAGGLSSKIWDLFNGLRKGDIRLTRLTPEQLQTIVKQWISEALEEDETQRALGRRHSIFDNLPFIKSVDEAVAVEVEQYDLIQEDLKDCLVEGDYRDSLKSLVDGVLTSQEVKLGTKTTEFNLACREFAKAYIGLLDVFKDRAQGIYDYTVYTQKERPQETTVQSTPVVHHHYVSSTDGMTVAEMKKQQKAKEADEPTLLELYEKFKEDKVLKKKWSAKTELDNNARVITFINLIGNPKLSEITQDMLRDGQKHLMNYPRNRNKIAKYRNLTTEKIKSMIIPVDERIGTVTIEAHIIAVNSFLDWVKIMYEMPSWFNHILEKPKREETMDTTKSRAVFDKNDLERMFKNDFYIKGVGRLLSNRRTITNNPPRFWLPLMSLYSGARLEELAQLYLSDFEIVDGVKCFSISSLAKDEHGNRSKVKQVKNRASVRSVPLHDELLNLGLWEYVDELKRRGKKRLFEELKPIKGRYGHAFSRWFIAYLHAVDVQGTASEGSKVFHSFRHTFINYCVQNRIPDDLFERVVGHAIEGNEATYKHYAKALSQQILKTEVMDKVDYGLNLSFLKNNPFTRRKEE